MFLNIHGAVFYCCATILQKFRFSAVRNGITTVEVSGFLSFTPEK
jgi:hypothetical protein